MHEEISAARNRRPVWLPARLQSRRRPV